MSETPARQKKTLSEKAGERSESSWTGEQTAAFSERATEVYKIRPGFHTVLTALLLKLIWTLTLNCCFALCCLDVLNGTFTCFLPWLGLILFRRCVDVAHLDLSSRMLPTSSAWFFSPHFCFSNSEHRKDHWANIDSSLVPLLAGRSQNISQLFLCSIQKGILLLLVFVVGDDTKVAHSIDSCQLASSNVNIMHILEPHFKLNRSSSIMWLFHENIDL